MPRPHASTGRYTTQDHKDYSGSSSKAASVTAAHASLSIGVQVAGVHTSSSNTQPIRNTTCYLTSTTFNYYTDLIETSKTHLMYLYTGPRSGICDSV
jgi:hypothetical protein